MNPLVYLLGKGAALLEKVLWETRYHQYRKQYSIDTSARFNGCGIYFYGDGSIAIGPGSYIGRYSSIQVANPSSVAIGRFVSISHFVKIYTSTFIADQDFSKKESHPDMMQIQSGNVTIGDYAWIGASVFICPGVTVGANSIIGANSVVTSDIPDNCIAAGAPAKVIKHKMISR